MAAPRKELELVARSEPLSVEWRGLEKTHVREVSEVSHRVRLWTFVEIPVDNRRRPPPSAARSDIDTAGAASTPKLGGGRAPDFATFADVAVWHTRCSPRRVPRAP